MFYSHSIDATGTDTGLASMNCVANPKGERHMELQQECPGELAWWVSATGTDQQRERPGSGRFQWRWHCRCCDDWLFISSLLVVLAYLI